jgi:hypothetical protein
VTTEQYNLDCRKQRIKKDKTHSKKREVMDPREFGAHAEEAVNDSDLTNMHSLDKWFAEIASKMKEKAPRRRIAQDPRIKELIARRIAMPRSRDGRARKELTLEIRKIIRTDTRNKKKEAIKEAFARHTNWAKNGQ